MSKIDVTSAATGNRLHGGRKWFEPVLEPINRSVAAMFRIDVKHNKIGNLTCDDSDIGVRPLPKPCIDISLGWPFATKMFPKNKRTLVAGTQRQN